MSSIFETYAIDAAVKMNDGMVKRKTTFGTFNGKNYDIEIEIIENFVSENGFPRIYMYSNPR